MALSPAWWWTVAPSAGHRGAVMCLLLLEVLLATDVPAKRRQRSFPTSPGHCARFRKPSAVLGCLGVDQAGQEQHCCLRGPRKRSLMVSYTRRLGLSVPVLVGMDNLQSRVHQHHHVRRRLDGCVAFNGRLLNESHRVLCRKWFAHKGQSHLRTNAGHHQQHHAPRSPEVRRTMMRTKRPSPALHPCSSLRLCCLPQETCPQRAGFNVFRPPRKYFPHPPYWSITDG